MSMDKILNLFERNFIKLFFGQLFTHFGDALVQVVLIGYIILNIEKPGILITLTLLCFIFPSFIISPIAGSIVDRFSRKKIMLLSAFFRAFVLIIMLIVYYSINSIGYFGSPVWIEIILLNLLIGSGTAFFYPAKMAIIPNIVESKSLKFANALVSSSGTWALTFGALVCTYIFTWIGSSKTVYFALVLYIMSGIILSGLKATKDDYDNNLNLQFSVIKDYRQTSNFLKSHKRALNMISLATVMALISSAIYNSMNVLATDSYHVGISGLAQLKCMLGCGTFYGVAIVFIIGRFFKTNRIMALAFLGLFICLITSPACNTFFKARFWLTAIGICAAILNITITTVLQKISPNFIRGKIFAFLSMLTTIASILATASVSVAIGFVHPILIIKIIAYLSAAMCLVVMFAGREFIYRIFKATLCKFIRL